MSDAPTPDHAEPVPSLEELQRTAVPAAIRHAPRLGRIMGTGVGIGIALGLVLGIALPNSTSVGRGVVILMLTLGFGTIGGLITGVIATSIDSPLGNQSDGPLFPQDAVATEQVATREPEEDAMSATDSADGQGIPREVMSADDPLTERPNGDTT